MKRHKAVLNLVGLFLILFFIDFSSVFANTATTSVDQSSLLNSTENLQVLSTKVDLVESLNTKVLNTVYWTLGVLAAIFLGLISINLYFNISANKNEIAKIREEILANTKNQILAMEVKITEKLKQDNKANSNALKEEMLTNSKNQIIALETKISEELVKINSKELDKIKSIISSEAENQILLSNASTLEKINTFEKKITEETTNIKNKVGISDSTVSDLKLRVQELEIYKYSKEGQMGSIIGLIDLLKKDVVEKSWRTTYHLKDIRKWVGEYMLPEEQAVDLEEQLSKLDPKYSALVKDIRSHVKIVTEEVEQK